MKRQVRTRFAVAAASAVLIAGSVGSTAAYAGDEVQQSTTTASAAKKTGNTRTVKVAEIRALFGTWEAAIETGDPETVADHYAPDGVLVPTLSNILRTDREGIVDYFEHFLLKKPTATITQSAVNLLDSNTAVDTGTYRFHLTDPETGVASDVDARYTFVYEKIDGEWMIINHHSSAMPEA